MPRKLIEITYAIQSNKNVTIQGTSFKPILIGEREYILIISQKKRVLIAADLVRTISSERRLRYELINGDDTGGMHG